jgi:phage gpG-like protein
MSDPTHELEGWLDTLIKQLSAGERKKLAAQIGRKLRKSQITRIKAQKNPDGSRFAKRAEKQKPINKPISFIYRKDRLASMVSFRDEGDRMIGYDIEAGGIRTFLKSRVRFYMKPRHTSGRKMRGFVRRKAMFSKIRQAKYLKGGGDAEGAYVEFVSKISHIARIHQFGKTGPVEQDGPEASYPQRHLLGFTADDVEMIKDTILDHLSGR